MRTRARVAVLTLTLVAIPCLGAELVDVALGVDPSTLGPAVDAPSSFAHPLGTDALGRDQLSRLLHGGRVSILVATLGAAGAFVLGVAIGALGGWAGGWAEAAAMRLTEATMALPKVPLMLVLAGMDLDRALGLRPGPASEVMTLVLVLTVFSWPDVARLARSEVRRLRRAPFVRAAEGLGLAPGVILRVHVLPHLAGPLGVALALDFGSNVLYESALSFLGLGVSPPTPSWGALLARGAARLHDAPAMMVLPGLLTLALVASVHVLAEELRARTDPASARTERG